MVDVNLNGGKCTPLTAECCKGHSHIVEKLIVAGADVNEIYGDNTSISKACQHEHSDLVYK